jgi:hypothetical protein
VRAALCFDVAVVLVGQLHGCRALVPYPDELMCSP